MDTHELCQQKSQLIVNNQNYYHEFKIKCKFKMILLLPLQRTPAIAVLAEHSNSLSKSVNLKQSRRESSLPLHLKSE